LIYEVSEFDKYLLITAIEHVKVGKVEEFLEELRRKSPATEVQVLRPDRVAGAEHLFFASLNALNAFKQKTNLCKGLPMEILLFASAQRQIKNAIEELGLKDSPSRLALVAVSKDRGKLENLLEIVLSVTKGKENEGVLDAWSKTKIEVVKKVYSISERELAATTSAKTSIEKALKNSIIGRMAILPTQT